MGNISETFCTGLPCPVQLFGVFMDAPDDLFHPPPTLFGYSLSGFGEIVNNPLWTYFVELFLTVHFSHRLGLDGV